MGRKRTKKNRLPKRSRGRSKFEIALRKKIAGLSPHDEDDDVLSSSASSNSSNLASPRTKRRRKMMRRERRRSDTSFETENDSDPLAARLSQVSLQVCSCEIFLCSILKHSLLLILRTTRSLLAAPDGCRRRQARSR